MLRFIKGRRNTETDCNQAEFPMAQAFNDLKFIALVSGGSLSASDIPCFLLLPAEALTRMHHILCSS